MKVEQIPTKEAKPWILKKHYAHRMPCVQYSFGLFVDQALRGVVAYGPTCRALNKGYSAFGEEKEINSFELVRLCIEHENKNAASFLVGNSLKMLPRPSLVVSYADANVGHVGYVYQSTNWLYCGVTSKRRKFLDVNGKDVHERTLVSRYGTSSSGVIPKDITIEEQEGKHKYIYICGNKSDKKKLLSCLLYPTFPYPKGESKRYDASAKVEIQGVLL